MLNLEIHPAYLEHNGYELLAIVITIIFLGVLIILVGRYFRKKEIEGHLLKLNQLHSTGHLFPQDKKYLEDFVKGKNYEKKKFENYLNVAITSKKRYDYLVVKYGEEIALRVFNNQYWIGMTKEQLIDAKGPPTKTETETLKTKTKEVLIYGNKSSGDYFVFENGFATKIVDR